MYNFKIAAICHDSNYDQIYALFGVNNFLPKIKAVSSFGHLEGLRCHAIFFRPEERDCH